MGCTRRGSNNPAPPTPTPQTTFCVDPKSGSDSTGNGTPGKCYKTLTKALKVVSKQTTTGLTISLAAGSYTVNNGEVFPIVVPTGVTINGSGASLVGGSYVNGAGEDTLLEKAVGASSGTYFTTLEVPSGVGSVSANQLAVGSKTLRLPSGAKYASVDLMGGISMSHTTFDAGAFLPKTDGGVIVPSGSLLCTACTVNGNRYAIEAFTLPSASSQPSITLTGQFTNSYILGKVGILTDGTATINAANQSFGSTTNAYRDDFALPIATPSTAPLLGTVDFGSASGSAGGNLLSSVNSALPNASEIYITLPGVTVTAFGNQFVKGAQGASQLDGQYHKDKTFAAGRAKGQNVTIKGVASGSIVEVGPIPTPTASPTAYPSTSPTASPTG